MGKAIFSNHEDKSEWFEKKLKVEDPKGGDLFLDTAKSEEIRMEAEKNSDVQIDSVIWGKRRKTHRTAW